MLSTLTVLNNLDKGPGSLRDAITKSKSGDSIVFTPSLSGQTITLTSGSLALKTSVDIEGPGASLLSISGNDTSRVFDISSGLDVRIAGLTITHGRAVGNWGGGAILNVGSALTLANDVFCSNRAVGSNADGSSMGGGAITNRSGGVLTVTTSSFTDNQAIGREGGFGEGGAIWNLAAATITDSTFTGNRALGGDGGSVTGGATSIGVANGGAIFNQTDAAHLTIVNSTFSSNEAIGGSGGSGGKGGSFYFVGAASGGGIANGDFATVVAGGCTFSHNRAVGGSNATGGASGTGRVGNASGGGLANLFGGVATVASGTFDHNEALGGSGNRSGSGSIQLSRGAGGAISNVGIFSSPCTLVASNLTVSNNRAAGGAGAPGDGGGDGVGGGLFNDGRSNLDIRGSTITGNEADGGVAGYGGSPGVGIGGGLYLAPDGNVCLDPFTIAHLFGNHASTSDDDVFGDYTACE